MKKNIFANVLIKSGFVLSVLSASILNAHASAPVCGPNLNGVDASGTNWVANCPAGADTFNTNGTFSGQVGTMSFAGLTLTGPTTVLRGAGYTSGTHNYIDTEITNMLLTGSGVTLKAGASYGLTASTGQISQNVGSNVADSFFDVFFELDIPGITLYGHEIMGFNGLPYVEPPANTVYMNPQVVYLYGTPSLTGQVFGYIDAANHVVDPIPEPETYTLLAVGLAGIALRARKTAKSKQA